MAKREIDYAVCSMCLESFDRKDMYIVNRFMHRGYPDKGMYSTIYCEKCTHETEGTIWNQGIAEIPRNKQLKVSKKRETKKKS
jgi:hypothetical protein